MVENERRGRESEPARARAKGRSALERSSGVDGIDP